MDISLQFRLALLLKRFVRFGACLVVLSISDASLGSSKEYDRLNDLSRSYRNTVFVPITSIEYQVATEYFYELFMLSTTPSESILNRAALVGLNWRYLGVDESTVTLQEADTSVRGQGIFVFTFNNNRSSVIQAPHQFFDLFTGKIALYYFFESGARSLAINTVNRNSNQQSDLAHQPMSLFSAHAEAHARAFPKGRLIQFHGFNRGKRASEAARSAEIIVSSGNRITSTRTYQLTQCLRQQTPFLVRLFGQDVLELGGTTNSSLAAMKKNRATGFIHIELALSTRQILQTSLQVREQFWRCLE